MCKDGKGEVPDPVKGQELPVRLFISVRTLWYKFVVLKETEGKCFLAVYADDFIAGFQHKSDAERYYTALKERLGKFNLELEESKSRLIEFGRFAEGNNFTQRFM